FQRHGGLVRDGHPAPGKREHKKVWNAAQMREVIRETTARIAAVCKTFIVHYSYLCGNAPPGKSYAQAVPTPGPPFSGCSRQVSLSIEQICAAQVSWRRHICCAKAASTRALGGLGGARHANWQGEKGKTKQPPACR